MYTLLLQVTDQTSDGLTFGEVLSGIPHDPAAFFIYALTGVAIGWVIWAGRKRPKDPGATG